MWIQFDAIPNARDLGGIAVADGRTVRPGLLLRGASLENASDADIARLQNEFQLRHIVDLRDVGERPSARTGPSPARRSTLSRCCPACRAAGR